MIKHYEVTIYDNNDNIVEKKQFSDMEEASRYLEERIQLSGGGTIKEVKEE